MLCGRLYAFSWSKDGVADRSNPFLRQYRLESLSEALFEGVRHGMRASNATRCRPRKRRRHRASTRPTEGSGRGPTDDTASRNTDRTRRMTLHPVGRRVNPGIGLFGPRVPPITRQRPDPAVTRGRPQTINGFITDVHTNYTTKNQLLDREESGSVSRSAGGAAEIVQGLLPDGHDSRKS